MKIGSNAQCTLSIIEAANTMVFSLNPSNYYNNFDLNIFKQGVWAHEEQAKISKNQDSALNFYPAMLYRYALFSYLSKDINGAVRSINEALALEPDNQNIKNLHAEIHNYKQEIFDRLNQSVIAGKRNSSYVLPVIIHSLLKLAEISQLDQKHEQAIYYAKQALELCPKDIDANRIYNESHKFIIMQHVKNSNYDEIIKRYPNLTCKDIQAQILSKLVERYIKNKDKNNILKEVLLSQTQLVIRNSALTRENISRVVSLIRNSLYIRKVTITSEIAPEVFIQLSEAIKFNIFLREVELNLNNISHENASHLFRIISVHPSVLMFNFYTDNIECKRIASNILPSNPRLLGYHINAEYFVCANNFVSNMCKLEKAIYTCKGKFNSITLSYSPIFLLQMWKGISGISYLDERIDFLVKTRSEIMLTLYASALPATVINLLELYILDSEKCGSIKTASLQITS